MLLDAPVIGPSRRFGKRAAATRSHQRHQKAANNDAPTLRSGVPTVPAPKRARRPRQIGVGRISVSREQPRQGILQRGSALGVDVLVHRAHVVERERLAGREQAPHPAGSVAITVRAVEREVAVDRMRALVRRADPATRRIRLRWQIVERHGLLPGIVWPRRRAETSHRPTAHREARAHLVADVPGRVRKPGDSGRRTARRGATRGPRRRSGVASA